MTFLARIKRIPLPLIALPFLAACRTVYIQPRLPEFQPPAIDYSRYNKDSPDDMRRIILLQEANLEAWEGFYRDLRESVR